MIALPDLGFDKCHMINALEVFFGTMYVELCQEGEMRQVKMSASCADRLATMGVYV